MGKFLAGWTSQGEEPELNPVLPDGAVPRNERVPVPRPVSEKRVREVTAKRTKTGKVYELADGRLQAELSSEPVHYRAADGSLRPIDTTIKDLANETNSFRSYFGRRTDQLVRFKSGPHELAMGSKTGKAVAPKVAGDTVTYPDVFGDADLVYQVGTDSLKEGIVLETAPADPTYAFSLKLAGVVAKPQPDGSIAFFGRNETGRPVLQPTHRCRDVDQRVG